MQLDLHDCELCLADNAPVRLSRARGLTVRCTAGRVWLTVDGEAGDIILVAGQFHRIRSNGLALLEAIGSGRVRLEPAPTALAGMRRLLSRRMAGLAASCQTPA